MDAHKVILAASSPFFQKLLGKTKHPHPLIYMKGLKSDDLLAIVDFLYRGEANIFQENLDSFLAVAEELQLKGLVGKTDENVQDLENEEKYLPSRVSHDSANAKRKESFEKKSKIQNPESGTLAIPSNSPGDFGKLEERVRSMMEKSENKCVSAPNRQADRCKVCGKEGVGSAKKDHIEANHLEGIVIPCNLCNKTFRSRNGFKLHKRHYHK